MSSHPAATTSAVPGIAGRRGSGLVARLKPPSSSRPSQNVIEYEEDDPRQLLGGDAPARVEPVAHRGAGEHREADVVRDRVGEKRRRARRAHAAAACRCRRTRGSRSRSAPRSCSAVSSERERRAAAAASPTTSCVSSCQVTCRSSRAQDVERGDEQREADRAPARRAEARSTA